MATIVHNKVATQPDDPSVEINKAEWNDNHALTLGLDENFVTDAQLAVIGASASGVSIPILTSPPVPVVGKIIIYAVTDGGSPARISLMAMTPGGNPMIINEVQE